MAVVLNELLQNAVEHAYPSDGGTVRLWLSNDGERLRVEIADDGVGLPDGFSLDGSSNLGLSIVRTLVTTELDGTIDVSAPAGADGRGARFVLSVPVDADGLVHPAPDATQPPDRPGAG
jgi:two-component sensor histidine kinase